MESENIAMSSVFGSVRGNTGMKHRIRVVARKGLGNNK